MRSLDANKAAVPQHERPSYTRNGDVLHWSDGVHTPGETEGMKVFYSDCFVLPLPEGHRFPMEKYSMLRERVELAGSWKRC